MPPMIITVGDLISLVGLLIGLPLLYLAMQKHIRDQLREGHDAETAVLRERIALYEAAVDPNVRELIEARITALEEKLNDKDQLIGEERERAEAEKMEWQQALDEANTATEDYRKRMEKALADRGVPADQVDAALADLLSVQSAFPIASPSIRSALDMATFRLMLAKQGEHAFLAGFMPGPIDPADLSAPEEEPSDDSPSDE